MNTLTLLSPLPYRPARMGMEELVKAVLNGEAGTDGALEIAFIYSDDLGLSIEASGLRPPYNAKEKALLENGAELARKPEETFVIPAGAYAFSQFPLTSSLDELRRLLLPWSAQAKHVYARFFKENGLHAVTQLFVPL